MCKAAIFSGRQILPGWRKQCRGKFFRKLEVTGSVQNEGVLLTGCTEEQMVVFEHDLCITASDNVGRNAEERVGNVQQLFPKKIQNSK